MTDPNVQTTPEGEQVILEPGDPGYVEPGQPTSTSGEPIDTQPPDAPQPDEPLGAIAPPGKDLQHVRQPGESDAEFMARTRNVAVKSESPTDIVPNTPQITIGQQVEVGEGLVAGVPPENLEEEVVEGEVVEGEPVEEEVVEEPAP